MTKVWTHVCWVLQDPNVLPYFQLSELQRINANILLWRDALYQQCSQRKEPSPNRIGFIHWATTSILTFVCKNLSIKKKHLFLAIKWMYSFKVSWNTFTASSIFQQLEHALLNFPSNKVTRYCYWQYIMEFIWKEE